MAEEVPFLAQNIVSQLGDLWEVPVEKRQATNDQADQFVAGLLADAMRDEKLRDLLSDLRREHPDPPPYSTTAITIDRLAAILDGAS